MSVIKLWNFVTSLLLMLPSVIKNIISDAINSSFVTSLFIIDCGYVPPNWGDTL